MAQSGQLPFRAVAAIAAQAGLPWRFSCSGCRARPLRGFMHLQMPDAQHRLLPSPNIRKPKIGLLPKYSTCIYVFPCMYFFVMAA
jgi:hypothetical protein